MSDILSLGVSEYFPNVLVDIITDFVRCKECDNAQRKFKLLKNPYFIRSGSGSYRLHLQVDDYYAYIDHVYYNLYGDRCVGFKAPIKYLVMVLVHNLDVNHLLSNMPKYDCDNMDQHFTLPRKRIISPNSFTALMTQLKDVVS